MNTAKRNLSLLNILTFSHTFVTFEGVWAIYYASITGSFAAGLGMFAVMHIASSSFEVPTGILSDYIGRKKTVILYCLFGFVAMLLFYLANSTQLLLIGSILVGISMALGSGTISAYVYENLELLNKADQYKKFEGKRRALTKYSKVTAGVLGVGIIYLYDIRTALLVTVCAVFISLVVSFFLKDIKVRKSGKNNIYEDLRVAFRHFKSDASLRDFSLGRMFARGVGNAEYRFRALFMSALMPDWTVNLVNLVAGLISGMAMHANHIIVNKFGFKKSLVHFEIINRSIVMVCAYIFTPISGIVLSITNSINHGISDIASDDLLQARYAKEQRATMGSLVALGGSIVYIITAVFAGFVADQIGLLNTMLIMQPFLLISAFFFWRGLRR